MAGWRMIGKSKSEMTTLKLCNQKGIVDKYLEDLYERELMFTIPDEECKQIQHGVENIVSKIVDEIAKSEPKFAIEMENILKVGSFYERTKICYPDEFDYLVVLHTYTPDTDHDLYEQERDMERIMKKVKQYPWYIKRAINHLEANGKLGIELDTGNLTLGTTADSIQDRGPATKLQANYTKDGIGEITLIEIDITAAIRVKGLPTEGLKDGSPSDKLLQMAHTSEQHLVLFNYNIDLPFIETFTESEIDFIVNSMSEGHKKAFMILKYLVNGKHTTEKEKYHVFSSYAIKTLLYEHCSVCTEELDISFCVLDVLKIMHKSLETAVSNISHYRLKSPIIVWHNMFTGRSFSRILGTEVLKRKSTLKRLINCLENEIGQTHEYCYEKCHVKPLIDFF